MIEFRRALEINPQMAEVHDNLGHVLRELRQPREALESCQRALQIDPNLAAAHGNMGNALLDLGRAEEAEACYRRALTLIPNRAELHSNLSRVLLDMGRVDEAIASGHRALEINPEPAQGARKSRRCAAQRQLRRGRAHYRQAVQFRPDVADLNNSLGTALRLMGRTAEAETFSRRALELSPQFAPAMATLAEARADRGDFAGRRRCLIRRSRWTATLETCGWDCRVCVALRALIPSGYGRRSVWPVSRARRRADRAALRHRQILRRHRRIRPGLRQLSARQ